MGPASCWELRGLWAGILVGIAFVLADFPATAETLQLSIDILADPPQAEGAPCGFSKRSVDTQPGTWEANQNESPEVSKEAYQTILLMT